MPRPTPEQYDAALELYRARRSPEQIATALDLDPDDVDRLIDDGWPARGGKNPQPELPSLSSQIDARVVRLRNAELQFAEKIAEAAANMATTRERTLGFATKVEQILMQAIHTTVVKAVEDAAKDGVDLKLEELVAPKPVLELLRTIRMVRDQGVDLRAADLFKVLRGSEDEEDEGSELDAIISAVAGLTPEQKREYIKTGKLPNKQLKLPLEKATG